MLLHDLFAVLSMGLDIGIVAPPVEEGAPVVDLGTSSDRPVGGAVVAYETEVRATCGSNTLVARFQQREPRPRAGYFKTVPTRLVVRQDGEIVYDDPSGLRDMSGASLVSVRPTCQRNVLGLEILLAPHENTDDLVWQTYQFAEEEVAYFRQETVSVGSRLRWALPRDR